MESKFSIGDRVVFLNDGGFEFGKIGTDMSYGVVKEFRQSGRIGVMMKRRPFGAHPSFGNAQTFGFAESSLALALSTRLYRAIIGALFGPESHSKERYKI